MRKLKISELEKDLDTIDPKIIKYFLAVENPKQFLSKLAEAQKEIK